MGVPARVPGVPVLRALVLVLLAYAGSASAEGTKLVYSDLLKYERLTAWFLSHRGAFLHPDVELRSIPGRGRGFYARANIASGTIIIGAPQSVSITPSAVLKRFPEWKALDLRGTALLALFLVVERFHLANDTWANMIMGHPRKHFDAYTSFMEHCENGSTMSKKDHALMQVVCGSVYTTNTEKEYQVNLVQSGFTKHAFPVTLEQLKWGMCRATSRSWQGDLMVPVMDLINHNLQHNSAINIMRARDAPVPKGTDEEIFLNSDRAIVTVADVKKGDELTIKYADKGMCDFWFMYGFVEPRSSFNYIALPMPPDLSATKLTLIRAALSSGVAKGETIPTRVRFSWKGFDNSHAAAVRVWAQPDDKLDSFFFSRVHGKPQEWYPDVENEMRTLSALLWSAVHFVRVLFPSVGPSSLRINSDVRNIQDLLVRASAELARRPQGTVTSVLTESFEMAASLISSVFRSVEELSKVPR